MPDTTTIKISRETWRELNHRKRGPGDTFDDVVQRLLADDEDDGDGAQGEGADGDGTDDANRGGGPEDEAADQAADEATDRAADEATEEAAE